MPSKINRQKLIIFLPLPFRARVELIAKSTSFFESSELLFSRKKLQLRARNGGFLVISERPKLILWSFLWWSCAVRSMSINIKKPLLKAAHSNCFLFCGVARDLSKEDIISWIILAFKKTAIENSFWSLLLMLTPFFGPLIIRLSKEVFDKTWLKMVIRVSQSLPFFFLLLLSYCVQDWWPLWWGEKKNFAFFHTATTYLLPPWNKMYQISAGWQNVVDI